MVAQTASAAVVLRHKIGDEEMGTTIQVFLNTSHDGYDGFRNQYSPPSVRLALKFELDDTITHKLYDGVPVTALERVFEQLNVGGQPGFPAAEPWCVEYRHNGNRSLSVGDVVVVGGTAYAVDSFGWHSITTDELLDAISRHRAAVNA